jgi:ABC-type nitrate/sulfonate/bicarbonate transport system permease component
MAQLARLHTSPRRRAPRLQSRGHGGGLLSLVVLLAIWSIAAAWLARTSDRAAILLPSPLDVVRSVPGLSVFGSPGAELTYANAARVIVDNTVASGGRLLAGLLLGIA